MNDKDKNFIRYYKYLKKAKEIIEAGKLTKKDVLRVNNLYTKADELLLEINKKKSYSTVGIIGGVAGGITAVALLGGILYYFGRKYSLKSRYEDNEITIKGINKTRRYNDVHRNEMGEDTYKIAQDETLKKLNKALIVRNTFVKKMEKR